MKTQPSKSWFVVLGLVIATLPAYAQNGALKINSIPAGATVSIDGVSTAKVTPMNISLPIGSHTVIVALPSAGWLPETRTITIGNGNSELNVTLVPAVSVGPQGPTGPQGIQGVPGVTGATGPTGAAASVPGVVGAWFGIARPCPATGDDVGHAAFCQAVCGACASTPGTMPPEMVLMSTIHADGNIVANDSGAIAVFHSASHGSWAADGDATQVQFAGKTRYQATFIWLQSDGGSPGQFIGVSRPRLVTYWDPENPDNMIGYIQPHFYPIVGPGGLVDVLTSGFKDTLNVTNHYPALDPLAPLPPGCTPFQAGGNCFGTFHFTLHRIKADVP